MTDQKREMNLWNHIRPQSIHENALRFRATFCLGGVSFLALLVVVMTGMLLLFYYQPGEKAFDSLVQIQSVYPYGGFFRGLHFWAAQLMVVTLVLHTIRVIVQGAYRPPRELNWVIGVVLFGVTVVLDFTGYLLRGNQESAAAATVGRQLLTFLPGGKFIAQIFFGYANSPYSSSLVLYIWHCFILPGVCFFLVFWHFWRIRRDGGVYPPL